MKVFTMNDGTKITARSARDLIAKMRQIGLPSRNEKEFMRNLAEMALMQDHTAKIPTDNIDKFVDALIRVGFIKAVDDYE